MLVHLILKANLCGWYYFRFTDEKMRAHREEVTSCIFLATHLFTAF